MSPAGPTVPGCLLLLVQATPSMAEPPGSWAWPLYPARRKLDAALVLVNGVIDRLIDRGSGLAPQFDAPRRTGGSPVPPHAGTGEPPVLRSASGWSASPGLDVAVLAYAGDGPNGGVRSVLPGSS